MPPNVYLIGLMGAGKTTIGRRLAVLSKRKFIDTDQALEQHTGVCVDHIFDLEGEEGFRRRESIFLQQVAQLTNHVIATGGGAVLSRDNCQTMKKSGTVVYLKVSLDVLWQRLGHCKNRPLLQTDNPRLTLKTLMRERDILYIQAADEVFEWTHGSADSTAQKIYTRVCCNANSKC